MNGAAALFTPEELKRLDRLRIRRRRRAVSEQMGDRRSARAGSGVLFQDHRDYVPGDDLRYVDWNVYARLGDMVVKRFEAEENLDLLLCVDRSLSMTGAKSLKARRIAAALGYIALAHLDRVRLAWLPVSPSLPVTIHRGRARAGALVEALAREPDEGTTAHGNDITKVLSVVKRRGTAVVLSDFYDPENAVAALAALRSQGMEVLAIHVLDVADVELTEGDSLLAVDRETGAEVKVDVTPAFLQSLRQTWHRRAESLERWCVTREVMYQRVEVSTSLWDALSAMLGTAIAVGAR